MLRIRCLLFTISILLASAGAANAQCSIKLGGAGKSATLDHSSDSTGPWEFIRSTSGHCTFEVFNSTNFQGRSVVYGTDVNKRIRIGALGAQDSEGWGARSVRITPVQNSACRVVLGDSGVSQTFLGPGQVRNISGWGVLRETTGACHVILFNGANFNGRQDDYTEARRQARLEWRVRSIKIE